MKFHSSLDSIIRIRKLLEDRQLRRVEQAQSLVRKTQIELDSAKSVAQNLSEVASQTCDPTPAAEFHFIECKKSSLALRIKLLNLEQLRQVQMVNQELQSFRSLRRERELVETIRNEQHQKWTLHCARRQQRQVDEMFLMRSQFNRKNDPELGEVSSWSNEGMFTIPETTNLFPGT